MGTRFIQINRSRSGYGRDAPLTAQGAECVEDVDNRLGPWFESARETIVIVRPDRFVAAVASPSTLEEVMNRLGAQIARA
jgi:3-(3-hydroxy-phenyl)propionate hydroxylase